MARSGALRRKKGDLANDLKETTISIKKLGEKYGVSGQAVHDFCQKHGIKRPLKPEGHQTGECRLCQKLIQISKRPHSEFISIHTIVEEIGVSKGKYFYHLRMLRDRGLVSQKFGRLRSERAEKAYAMYFTERLPIRAIGQRVGLRNFHSIIRMHRELGWNVPPSLYDKWRRSRIQSEMHRRKK